MEHQGHVMDNMVHMDHMKHMNHMENMKHMPTDMPNMNSTDMPGMDMDMKVSLVNDTSFLYNL